jgi:hypothetical protein
MLGLKIKAGDTLGQGTRSPGWLLVVTALPGLSANLFDELQRRIPML